MLSKYLAETSIMVNDVNFVFTSKIAMTMWINEGRRNLAKRTGCVRRLITGQSPFGASSQPGIAVPGGMTPGSLPDALPYGQGTNSGGGFNNGFNQGFQGANNAGLGLSGAVANPNFQTIAGVERLPYVGFFNPILQAEHAGCDVVLDVIDLAISWGGVDRPVLDWLPFDSFQAYARAYAVLNTSFPSVWTVINDGAQGEVYIFPLPSQPGDIEADVFCLPKPLYSDDDFECIPAEFHEVIKFAAAELVFAASGRYSQAEQMRAQYADRVSVAVVARDRGKLASQYWTVP